MEYNRKINKSSIIVFLFTMLYLAIHPIKTYAQENNAHGYVDDGSTPQIELTMASVLSRRNISHL